MPLHKKGKENYFKGSTFRNRDIKKNYFKDNYDKFGQSSTSSEEIIYNQSRNSNPAQILDSSSETVKRKNKKIKYIKNYEEKNLEKIFQIFLYKILFFYKEFLKYKKISYKN